MSRRIIINERAVEVLLENVELDEYEIGSDGGKNPSVGGSYCHVMKPTAKKQTVKEPIKEVVDRKDSLLGIGSICYTVDPDYFYDEDDFNNWEEYYSSEDEYKDSCAKYETETFDNDGHHLECYDGSIDYMEELYGEKIANMMRNKEGRKDGNSYWIENISYDEVNSGDMDLTNPEKVIRAAKMLSSNTGPSKYILTDGSVVSFNDHSEVQSIGGMTISKFLELGHIRVGAGCNLLCIELMKKPTREQFRVLEYYLEGVKEVYVDYVKPSENEGMYPDPLFSSSYIDQRHKRVINDMFNYFTEGVRPITENIETEVESGDIDLSSFRKMKELVPEIWDGDTMDSRVRLKLLDIADDFWKHVNLTWVKPKGIIVCGSICNYNWSEYSDIDLHLIVDFSEVDEKTEFVKTYFDMKKNEWNDEHSNLNMHGFNVELYVQNTDDELQAGGIYDLEQNKWVRKPDSGDIKPIKLNKFVIKSIAAKIMTRIDDIHDKIYSTDDSYEVDEMGDSMSSLLKKVREKRSESLKKDGESGRYNIIYKILRRTGYLDKAWDVVAYAYDKVNSIDESKGSNKEVIKEYLEKNYAMPLYNYFKDWDTASDYDKCLNFCEMNTNVISEYIDKRLAGDINDNEYEKLTSFDYDDYEGIEDFCKFLDEKGKCYDFVEYVASNGYYMEIPAWYNMDLIGPVKNEWLIHFTDDALGVVNDGFIHGTDDFDNLAYTNAGETKGKYPGYNFAFKVDDRNVDFNNYGREAVIFRASGVECFHYGDNQNQVIFYGPSVKNLIPIKHNESTGEWEVINNLGNPVASFDEPSEAAEWVIDNLPQYRKKIMSGKNGYIPTQVVYDNGTYKRVPYPLYRNESVKKYISLLKESVDEEVVADGSSNHNPYAKRWKAERQALKDFLSNYGKLMMSKENGKVYKVYFDQNLSNLIGYNYCICVQWDEVELKPESTVYVRAYDKFTENIRTVQNDTRGRDNSYGTGDDSGYAFRYSR